MTAAIPINFTALSASELIAFAVLRQDEMGVGGLTESDITDALTSGRAVVETRPFGFAVIEQKPTADGKKMPHLWLLFVDQQNRLRGLGRRFVRELLKRYAVDYHMSMYCSGARRRAFFGRLGFRIESQDGNMRRMTTNTEIK